MSADMPCENYPLFIAITPDTIAIYMFSSTSSDGTESLSQPSGFESSRRKSEIARESINCITKAINNAFDFEGYVFGENSRYSNLEFDRI